MTLSLNRWVEYAGGAHRLKGPHGRLLERKLARVGKTLGHRVRVTSGLRTAREQWFAYQDYLSGGTLAAPCCSKHYPHSWAHCLRQCASNHCCSRAADVEAWSPEKGWVSIGLLPQARRAMKRVGLCLPVGSGEVWHVEVGSVWCS